MNATLVEKRNLVDVTKRDGRIRSSEERDGRSSPVQFPVELDSLLAIQEEALLLLLFFLIRRPERISRVDQRIEWGKLNFLKG